MRILYDGQIFDSQMYGGISRYFSELIQHIKKTDAHTCIVPITHTKNFYLQKILDIKPAASLFDIVLKRTFRYKKIFEALHQKLNPHSNRNNLIREMKRGAFDIFHPTYYDSYFTPYLHDKPYVITVYDMIHELYPQFFNYNFFFLRHKKKSITRAHRIIAISEHTKRDLMRIYNIPEHKIDVVYLANSLQPSHTSSPIPNTRYILFVGSRGIYKNFTFFIESIAPLLQAQKDLRVLVTGGYQNRNSFTEAESQLFKKLAIEHQVIYQEADDTMLASLYQHALCFVFPSLYEGFGIPILEAFACSCPVVASRTSSLQEIGGDAAFYFDPLDHNSILSAVREILSNSNIRNNLVAKGLDRVKMFSWDITAAKTIEVYRKVLAQHD